MKIPVLNDHSSSVLSSQTVEKADTPFEFVLFVQISRTNTCFPNVTWGGQTWLNSKILKTYSLQSMISVIKYAVSKIQLYPFLLSLGAKAYIIPVPVSKHSNTRPAQQMLPHFLLNHASLAYEHNM